jgi:hypothetical protein
MNEKKIDTPDTKSKSRFSYQKRDHLEKPSTELNNLSIIHEEVVFVYFMNQNKLLDLLKLKNFKG